MKQSTSSIPFGAILVILASACVDRLYIDIENSLENSVVIYGYISDQPGPYRVEVSKSFDVESRFSPRMPISVKSIVLSDNLGTEEALHEVSDGVYETPANGMKGVIGRAYKITVELLDGRVYESIPDTLYAGGTIDSLYYNFIEERTANGASQYMFDVRINSSAMKSSHGRFLWQFTGTFKAMTSPENNHKICEYYKGKCNFVPLCSGLVNVGTGVTLAQAVWEREKPCECCTCWYSFSGSTPTLSDDQYNQSGNYIGTKLQQIPLNAWVFMNKLHVKASQLSLSPNAFRFWKAIKDQKEGVNSLFQPLSGVVPTNFVQTFGKGTPINGIFYATSITDRSFYITPEDVPRVAIDIIRPKQPPVWNDRCETLFPNATVIKPDFWVD
jgi:hypothetical protein